MTKANIVDQILTLLPREDKVSRYHPMVVEAACEKVIIEMYNDIWKANPRLLDKYCKRYGATTPITIVQEAGTNIYYSTLPVRICTVPDKASGVRHIYPRAYTGNQFVPMDATDADFVFNTDVAIVSSKIGYMPRQDTRVDYWNTNAVVRSAGVLLDLLVPFMQYADTDEVTIPELTEADGVKTFFERVLNVLGVIPPVDLKDDNKNAQTNTKQ